MNEHNELYKRSLSTTNEWNGWLAGPIVEFGHTKDGSDKGQEKTVVRGVATAPGSDWMQSSESTTKLHPFLSSSSSSTSDSSLEDGEGGLNQHGSLVIKDEWTRNQNEELDPNIEIIEGRRAVPAFIR